jgi:predicted alpha/beta hydrolase family esterase
MVQQRVWIVHGLTGNREKTWTHDSSHTFWPDLLAKDFPAARIITYGYDANIVGFQKKTGKNAEKSGLHSYGEALAKSVRNARQGESALPDLPIYFIAHSLGGLVVEQALLICLTENSLNDIAKKSQGIFFMGTPHRGSHLAKWGSLLKTLSLQRLRTTNDRILAAQTEDSDVAKDLEDQFQLAVKRDGGLEHVELHCFYETIVMNGHKKEVVPRKSATLPGVAKTPISGTHTTMVRFESESDSEYLKVKGELEAWVNPIEHEDEEEDDDRHSGGMRVTGPSIGTVSGGNPTQNQYNAQRDMYNDRASKVGRDQFSASGARGKVVINQRGNGRKKPNMKGAGDRNASCDDEDSDFEDDSSDYSV